jgi:spore coat polysaccharide biosynthesis protein SpsF
MILAVVQARMSSTRMPGKVLMPIMSKPMLLQQVERIKRSKLVDKVIVATSCGESDRPIIKFCEQNKIDCWRGPLYDVLTRVYGAAIIYNSDIVIRLTGDCPLTCPDVIDKLLEFFIPERKLDYLGNTTVGLGWPDGLDVEIMTFRCLERAWRRAKNSDDREHVTSYIYKSGLFECFGPLFYHKPFETKLSVDTQEDFNRISKIFETLYLKNPEFGLEEIIKYLEGMN